MSFLISPVRSVPAFVNPVGAAIEDLHFGPNVNYRTRDRTYAVGVVRVVIIPDPKRHVRDPVDHLVVG